MSKRTKVPGARKSAATEPSVVKAKGRAFWAPAGGRARKGMSGQYSALYAADALERVEQVREGVPAELIDVMSEDMGIAKERLYTALRLPRATVQRKLQAKQPLSPDESERVLGVARLVGQVQAMVQNSGEPDGFDAARWLADWLERPNPALGRKRPSEFLDTADGRILVSDLLSRMSSGAYS